MNDYSALFTPINIGNVTIKNRYAMAPMVVSHAYEDGAFTESSMEYYLERARGGVGLIITGAAKVDNEIEILRLKVGGPNTNPPLYVERLKQFTDKLKETDTKVFIQLTAGAGRSIFTEYAVDGYMVAPSVISNRWDPTKIHRALSIPEIKKIVDLLGDAAKLCKEGGADGIEIHALHEGYLLDSFSMSFFNHRTDEYGGSLENRLRFAKEIIENIREKCGPDFPVAMRFSLKSFVRGIRKGGLPEQDFEELGRDIEEGLKVAKLLEEYGYDALDVDAGTYDSWYWAHPPYFHKKGLYLEFAEKVKSVVNIPVICAGMMEDPDLALSALESGKLDMVSIGRGHITEPEFCNKIKNGEFADIRPCLHCHEGCFNYNRVRTTSCVLNARAGHELEKPLFTETDNPLKIAVIGAGPAGMECARLLASKKHKVDVYEKSNEAGGLFRYAAMLEFKSDVTRVINWWKYQMDKLGVTMHYNVEVNENSDFLNDADVIICATGSNDFIPKLEGIDGANVHTAKEVLETRNVGNDVVIIGGGLVGCELAISLAKEGKHISIVEMQSEVLPGKKTARANEQMIREYLDFYGVKQYTNTKAVKVLPNALVAEQNGAEFEIPASDVVVAIGYTPENKLYEQCLNRYRAVLNVGDCYEVTDVLEAVARAYEICKYI